MLPTRIAASISNVTKRQYATSATKLMRPARLPPVKSQPQRRLEQERHILPSTTPPRIEWYRKDLIRRGVLYLVYGANTVVAWCAIAWVRDHYIRWDTITGSSMAPTINPTTHETGKKDCVVFRPYLERISERPAAAADAEQASNRSYAIQRGDIVTFWKPHKPEEVSIKRVIAIEGDTVYPKRGYALDRRFVMRERLQGMPDGLPDDDRGSVLDGRQEIGKIVIPYGFVWVEGDNARQSLDSNDFGPISKSLIKEKAVWIWKDWTSFIRIEDTRTKREHAMASNVVPGRSQIPSIFLE